VSTIFAERFSPDALCFIKIIKLTKGTSRRVWRGRDWIGRVWKDSSFATFKKRESSMHSTLSCNLRAYGSFPPLYFRLYSLLEFYNNLWEPSRNRVVVPACQCCNFLTVYGAMNREVIGLSYRPARLHRMAKSIPWNRFLATKRLRRRIKNKR
jgi:hypothetical protein